MRCSDNKSKRTIQREGNKGYRGRLTERKRERKIERCTIEIFFTSAGKNGFADVADYKFF